MLIVFFMILLANPLQQWSSSKEDIEMTKYIFVTGGVVSGLGKGMTAPSLGHLLKARGLKVIF